MYNMTTDVGCVSFEDVCADARDKKALLLLTGGLDSAYILWKYARFTNDILCHHIQLNKNFSNRWESENLAVNKQVEYIRNEGKNIKLFTSSFECSELGVPPVRDWFASVILSINMFHKLNFSYIVVGDDLPDSYVRSQSFSNLPEKTEKEIKALSMLVDAYTSYKVKISTALDTNLLSEAYNEMPEKYRKLIFSCRNPKLYDKNSFVSCGVCPTCLKNRYFGWRYKISNRIYV